MYELKFKFVFQYTPTKEIAEKAFTIDEIERGDALLWRQHFEIDKKWKYIGRFMYTNFLDDSGVEIYEGHICRGYKWNTKYKKKPKLEVKVGIQMDLDEAMFYPIAFGPMPGFEKLGRDPNYRGIGFDLQSEYDRKKNQPRVSKNLRVLGWYLDFPEIRFNEKERSLSKIKAKIS